MCVCVHIDMYLVIDMYYTCVYVCMYMYMGVNTTLMHKALKWEHHRCYQQWNGHTVPMFPRDVILHRNVKKQTADTHNTTDGFQNH